MARCGLCGGWLVLLGLLGKTKQFRCRQCGMIFSVAPGKARGKDGSRRKENE
jgi:hypothetical protein